MDTVAALKAERVRVSAVSLSAEVHAFRLVSHATGGTFGVALDKEHFARLVMQNVPPPVIHVETGAPDQRQRKWIQMAFPLIQTDMLSFCAWYAWTGL
jgi:transcription initiation factor TFIIH subunit 2